MLRTHGIPSRWVKGYSEGEFKRLADEGKRVFEITNNNAHSWVEVYFNHVGWVPFEPTKGFSNNVLFNYDTDSTTQLTEPEPIKKEQLDAKQPKLESNDNGSFSLQEIWSWCKNVVANQFVWILVTLLAFVVSVWMIYRSRKRWLPYFLIWKYKRVKQDKQFAQAYLELLKQFDRLGLKRKEDQTLRAYAHYVDDFYRTQDMGRLTSRYEQYLYKGSLPEGSWIELRELWEKLIKKTIA
jgi:hypothetical protein